MLRDLVLVMPVYNEEECIANVVESWLTMLSHLNVNFLIIVLNDGSIDGTRESLTAFINDDRIEVINKKNSGHGPTILMGYQRAVRLAKWVFQCDSDDEMKPEYFPILWGERAKFDALFGVRSGRSQNLSRKFISFCSRFCVRLLFGSSITDVNTPYRLVRSNILKQVVDQIPEDTFAPNVIISGALSKAKLRVYELSVPHITRKTGELSLVKWKLWRSAAKSLRQTLLCRPVIDALDHEDAKTFENGNAK